MTYILTEPPLAEPVTLAEVKAHLRLDHAEEDALLAGLIRVARAHLERETGLCLMVQAWRLCLDDWPADGLVALARGPVRTIEDVSVYDGLGQAMPVPLTGHVLDAGRQPARLWLENRPLPGRAINGIEIDFTAGFGEAGADVPASLTRAILLHVAHMHAFRGVVSLEDQPAGVPAGYERLIAPYRMRRL
ncbi:head-tail connector protein [Rhizobium sp. CSW-27]|uniref:head-tail connector protein n=1 Tax=Rhizobium sp. CSW-27 TaxID=2839985 RepID=UPI001C024C17|nr:head-tail connector protein [Rhizobium sp. CSW-27]MBT9368598.1 head-tail connector protein [Rhizobium sp. CSW-27]